MMRSMVRLLIVWLWSTLSIAQAAVIVVDASGSGSFTDIQSGINAATSGDIVVVEAGIYGSSGGFELVSINGKGITLIARHGPFVTRLGGIGISNLTATQTVVVRGFSMTGNGSSNSSHVVSISNNTGHTWLEDCVIGSSIATGSNSGKDGLYVAIANATLTRCTITGGEGASDIPGSMPFGPYGTRGGNAIRLFNSDVAVHDCNLLGGKAGSWSSGIVHYAQGGAGVLLSGPSTALLSGSTAKGGVGSNGHGIFAYTSSVAWLLDSTIEGGSHPLSGTDGLPIFPANAQTHSWPATARKFSLSSPAQQGNTVALELDGEPGDLVLLFLGQTGAFQAIPGGQGWYLPGLPPQGPFVLGTLTGPDGKLTLTLPAPMLPSSSVGGATMLFQPWFLNGATATAGSGSAFVLTP